MHLSQWPEPNPEWIDGELVCLWIEQWGMHGFPGRTERPHQARTQMPRFMYFAYGSNMRTVWLTARCPTAEAVGVAFAQGYRLEFSKRSQDGSGKATLVPSLDSTVPGVLFSLHDEDAPRLDAAEGKAYHRANTFKVSYDDGNEVDCVTYIAVAQDPLLRPYEWYKRLVVTGARQHHLPLEHIAALEAIEAIPDLLPARPQRLTALRLLDGI